MNLTFSKYQGTGNDFILIDDRAQSFPTEKTIISKLCDRHFGIGADGLILIREHVEHDYHMVYFNSDGSQSLCGNGSRCGFAFAQDLGIVADKARFETTDGVHQIKSENGLIHFQLMDVHQIQQLENDQWYLDTGSPHHIILTEHPEEVDVRTQGAEIRYSPSYARQNGTNVNFAQLLPDKVSMRTYERGVEDETLSCGTGATAVGIMAGCMGYTSPVCIQTKGGTLEVYFQEKENRHFTDVWLAGPAVKVYEGSVSI